MFSYGRTPFRSQLDKRVLSLLESYSHHQTVLNISLHSSSIKLNPSRKQTVRSYITSSSPISTQLSSKSKPESNVKMVTGPLAEMLSRNGYALSFKLSSSFTKEQQQACREVPDPPWSHENGTKYACLGKRCHCPWVSKSYPWLEKSFWHPQCRVPIHVLILTLS